MAYFCWYVCAYVIAIFKASKTVDYADLWWDRRWRASEVVILSAEKKSAVLFLFIFPEGYNELFLSK